MVDTVLKQGRQHPTVFLIGALVAVLLIGAAIAVSVVKALGSDIAPSSLSSFSSEKVAGPDPKNLVERGYENSLREMMSGGGWRPFNSRGEIADWEVSTYLSSITPEAIREREKAHPFIARTMPDQPPHGYPYKEAEQTAVLIFSGGSREMFAVPNPFNPVESDMVGFWRAIRNPDALLQYKAWLANKGFQVNNRVLARYGSEVTKPYFHNSTLWGAGVIELKQISPSRVSALVLLKGMGEKFSSRWEITLEYGFYQSDWIHSEYPPEGFGLFSVIDLKLQ